MERYIRLSSEKIKNLTSEELRVYSYSGDFVILAPEMFDKKDPSSTHYVVSKDGYNSLVELGVDKGRLFYAGRKGVGRNGKSVWMLLSYNDNRVRLMPF